MSILERQREELESGPGGDHDLPYSFHSPHIILPTISEVTASPSKLTGTWGRVPGPFPGKSLSSDGAFSATLPYTCEEKG
jgi:hypothetical protein